MPLFEFCISWLKVYEEDLMTGGWWHIDLLLTFYIWFANTVTRPSSSAFRLIHYFIFFIMQFPVTPYQGFVVEIISFELKMS
jgi:hypothetical protein